MTSILCHGHITTTLGLSLSRSLLPSAHHLATLSRRQYTTRQYRQQIIVPFHCQSRRWQSSPVPAAPNNEPQVPAPVPPKGSLPTRVWTKVKHEAQHYWTGTKLLGKEVSISTRIATRLLRGKSLTRRETRQLKRTLMDLIRVIPLLAFVLIPFMELALPIALRLFPNMLPSTFESKFAAEEKKRKLLRIRLETAKFLQETIKESGLKAQNIESRLRGKEEMRAFVRKVRDPNRAPSHDDIVRCAQLFDDDLTLDNLSKSQLVSVCRYLNIMAYGTDNFLRYQIRSRLNYIKRDDKVMLAEGLDTMTDKEVSQACQSRGLRTIDRTPEERRDSLEQWIRLYVTENISGVLLILARAFDPDGTDTAMDKSLEAVLMSLPDTLLQEAELDASDVNDPTLAQQKLEVLQQQEELIEDEAEQEERAEQAELEEKQEKAAQDVDSSPSAAEEPGMTEEQLQELGDALSILSSKSVVLKEREELEKLRSTDPPEEAQTDKATASLQKKVDELIADIDEQLSIYDEKESNLPQITQNLAGQVSLNDVKRALGVIAHAPPAELIEKLAEKLDVDKDGFVALKDVLELAQSEGGQAMGIGLDEKAVEVKEFLGKANSSTEEKQH